MADPAPDVIDGARAPNAPLLINPWRLTDMIGNAVQPAGRIAWSCLLLLQNILMAVTRMNKMG